MPGYTNRYASSRVHNTKQYIRDCLASLLAGKECVYNCSCFGIEFRDRERTPALQDEDYGLVEREDGISEQCLVCGEGERGAVAAFAV